MNTIPSNSTNNSFLSNLVNEGALLIDVRSEGEFMEGSIVGAINIPLDMIELECEDLDKNKPIIVFCRSGARSSIAKSILTQKGFTDIINGGSITNVIQELKGN